MRIIYWLTATAGVAAIATAAPARPGGNGPGHGGGLQVGWSNGGGQHSGKGRATRFGYGRIEIDRRDGRRHGRFGRSGRDDTAYYGGGGIGGPVGEVDPYGNGFFNGGGGRIRVQGDRPHFDYDRAYPYEWASASRARDTRPAEAQGGAAPPTARCTFEAGVRVCRGW